MRKKFLSLINLLILGMWSCFIFAGITPVPPARVIRRYAYAVGKEGLFIFDVSDPSNVYEVGRYKTTKPPKGLDVSGYYAYIIDNEFGLTIIDVSDPTAPRKISSWVIGGTSAGLAQDIDIMDKYAYIAFFDIGLAIVNVTSPFNPRMISCWRKSSSIGDIYSVDVDGKYAYLAHSYGLTIIDISAPFNPREKSHCFIRGGARDIKVVKNYAYIASGGNGFTIVDMHNITTPRIVGHCNTVFARGVDAVGNYIYIADGGGGLAIILADYPTEPRLISRCEIGGFARRVYVKGEYAYVADERKGLVIIDVHDPTNPVITARMSRNALYDIVVRDVAE